MCLIIFKPAGVPINAHGVRSGFYSNRDGAGFMAHNKQYNTLTVRKGFFKLQELLEALRPYENMSMAIHLRAGTSGKRDKTNCHPFKFGDNMALVHNGVFGGGSGNFSDTWVFTQKIKTFLKENPDINIFDDALVQGRLANALHGNRVVFMNGFGQKFIANEKSGDWAEDGCWYSNSARWAASKFLSIDDVLKESVYTGSYVGFDDEEDEACIYGYGGNRIGPNVRYKDKKRETINVNLINTTNAKPFAMCDGCDKPIMEDEQLIEIKDKRYHHSCFKFAFAQ